jgi:hypothetical protein
METTDGRLKFKQGRKINNRTYQCVGFLPSNYIGSGALCQSASAVSEKDTRLVSEDKHNYESVKTLIPT